MVDFGKLLTDVYSQDYGKHPMITETFDRRRKELPTEARVKEFIVTEWDSWEAIDFGSYKYTATYPIRKEYTKHSFPILTHEFILGVGGLIKELGVEEIVELACGKGWFSYWLMKYGMKVSSCIDDGSWGKGRGVYLDIVEKVDAVKFMLGHKEVELFILSWPYMDSLAYDIWMKLQCGQYLFYIGEDEGGCNASDSFFDKVKGSEVQFNGALPFVSFSGLHDRLMLYRK